MTSKSNKISGTQIGAQNASDLNDTPKSMRIQIAIFGRRNVGKSSLINALSRQQTSLVSDVAGTTTDPVEKAMELLPLGPVLLIDTAGIDDEGELGQARIERTHKVLDSADLAIIATEPGIWDKFELEISDELHRRGIPFVVAITKRDLVSKDETPKDICIPNASAIVNVSSTTLDGINELKNALVSAAPEELIEDPHLLSDLIPKHGLAVLVIPVDKEAPKGRIILPQVQALRDLLDGHASALVVQDTELENALGVLAKKPDIVVTDSQAFNQVSKVVPKDVALTGFSILFARFKGDLSALVRGAATLDKLSAGDSVLIAESCTHHPICDDIGTVKLPRILNQFCADLNIEHCQGTMFVDDLAKYKLVIHCGSCMLNRAGMLRRIAMCKKANVPITNYGMTIAHSLGILDRALEPFDGALQQYLDAKK